MEEIAKFIATLMASRNQAHVAHLQTQSFAAHMALQAYYEGIIPLIDAYVETAQSRYGIVTGYAATNMAIIEDNNPLKYFAGLQKFVDNIRQVLPQDGELNNTVDEISALVSSTVYKLKFLK